MTSKICRYSSFNYFVSRCILKSPYIRFLFIQSLWTWFPHKTEFLLNLNVFMYCLIPILCSPCCIFFRCVAFLGSIIFKKLLPFVVLPVVFVHLYAWHLDAWCVCVFMLFHLLVSSGCTTSVIYVRSSDQRSFVLSIFWVLLPSSFIFVSESILFHLQRLKLQPLYYWRENDRI